MPIKMCIQAKGSQQTYFKKIEPLGLKPHYVEQHAITRLTKHFTNDRKTAIDISTLHKTEINKNLTFNLNL